MSKVIESEYKFYIDKNKKKRAPLILKSAGNIIIWSDFREKWLKVANPYKVKLSFWEEVCSLEFLITTGVSSFVTNSSSTSFCIVGVYLDDVVSKIEERVQELGALYKTKTGYELDVDDLQYSTGELIAGELIECLFPDVSVHYDYENGGVYLGH